MADISLIVDYTQVKQANEAILAVGTTAQKSASVFEKAFKKVEASQRKALSDVKQQMAASKRLGAQKLKEANMAEKAAQALAKEEERLKNKFVEGYTAMNIYTKELNDLAIARKKDIITADQQAAAVEALNADMAAGTGAFRSYGDSVQQTRSKQSQLGVLFQQTGYQVGDFAVQVQSGQNAMVAFGQQATQLVGTFGMLSQSTKMIAVFAGLGIAVPILTAIGAAFMRASGQGKTLKQTVDSLKSSMSDLNSLTKNYTSEGLSSLKEKYGEVNAQVLKLIESQKFLAEIQLNKSIKDTINSLSELAGGRWFDIGISEKASALLSLRSQFELTKNEAETLYEAFQEVSSAEKGSLAQADALARVSDMLKTILSSTDNVTTAQLEALQAVLDTESAIREANVSLAATTVEGGKLADELERAAGTLGLIATAMDAIRKSEAYATKVGGGRGFSQGATAEEIQKNVPAAQLAYATTFEPPKTSRSAGGGGGGSGRDSQLDSFISSLMTERETLEQWRSEQVDLLGQFNETELEIIGGHAEAKLRLEQEYSDKLVALKASESQIIKSQSSAMYSALGGFLDQFAGKSKAAAVASVALNKALSIAQAIQNTSVAYTKALIMDPTGAMAARVAMLGKIQVGLIAATGLSQAASAASGGASGTVSGSASGAAATMPTQAVAATPQRVIIEGIDRDSFFSGEQLSRIFEAIYEENENRGMVFEVAR
tara:strand:- start:34534 stop:36687 length:2154 start_codon:yes stop_codon:yes gene_type:complete